MTQVFKILRISLDFVTKFGHSLVRATYLDLCIRRDEMWKTPMFCTSHFIWAFSISPTKIIP